MLLLLGREDGEARRCVGGCRRLGGRGRRRSCRRRCRRGRRARVGADRQLALEDGEINVAGGGDAEAVATLAEDEAAPLLCQLGARIRVQREAVAARMKPAYSSAGGLQPTGS